MQELSINRKLQIYLSQSKQIWMPAIVTDSAFADQLENWINSALPLFYTAAFLGLILGQTKVFIMVRYLQYTGLLSMLGY